MKKNIYRNFKKIIAGVCIFCCMLTMLPIDSKRVVEAAEPENSNVVYLSDIDYIKADSSTEQGSIMRDRNSSNKKIQLVTNVVDNNQTIKTFIKGVSAWATSEIVYDIGEYGLDRFQAYVGVDASEQNTYYNSGVVFEISLSNDKSDWNTVYKSPVLKGWDVTNHVDIELKGSKYLKLRADKNGGNWYSHWYDNAVYADAKLIKTGYTNEGIELDNYIKTVADYDAELSSYTSNTESISDDAKLMLLQKEYVSRIGYDVLSSYYTLNGRYKYTIDWLMKNKENLQLYLDVNLGSSENYTQSLKLLSTLLQRFKNDFTNPVLKKMAMALSMSHINGVSFWAEGSDASNKSEIVTRYEIFKDLREKNRLKKELFDTASIAEMRIIMANQISDDQIEWLNWYAASKNGEDYSNPNLDHKSYIKYNSKMDWNYNNPSFFTQEGKNTDTINAKYGLIEHDVTQGVTKLWSVMEEGAVCGGQSKTGANLRGVYGYPSFVIGQPGHAAYFYQELDGDIKKWSIGNNIYGWWKSEYGGNMLGWTASFNGIRWAGKTGPDNKYYTGSYLLLEQAAIDRIVDLRASQNYIRLAQIATNLDVKEKLYNKALASLDISIPAWLGLLDTYNKKNTSEDDYVALAARAGETLKYYPLPMSDYLALIRDSYVKDGAKKIEIDNIRTQKLNEAKEANESVVKQADVVKNIATNLLSAKQIEMATFSLDGNNAGKIIFDESYRSGTTAGFYYSLTGTRVDENGDSAIAWNKRTDGIIELTKEELDSLNEENGILVKIEGLTDAGAFSIPLTRATKPEGVAANDNDDVVVGTTPTMEWSLNSGKTWTRFGKGRPDLTGDRTVWVRNGATGHTLVGLEHIELKFTESKDPADRRYISATNVKVNRENDPINPGSSSFYGNFIAQNMLDGSLNTYWSSSQNANADPKRSVEFVFDKERFISAIEIFPRQDRDGGRPKDIEISAVTAGGAPIKVLHTISDIPKTNTEAITVNFDTPVYTRYLCIKVVESYDSYACLSLINFYEDRTKSVEDAAEYTPVSDTEIIELFEKNIFNKGTVRITEEYGIKYICSEDFINKEAYGYFMDNTIMSEAYSDVAVPMLCDKNGQDIKEGLIQDGMLLQIYNYSTGTIDFSYIVIVPKEGEEIEYDTWEDVEDVVLDDTEDDNNDIGNEENGGNREPEASPSPAPPELIIDTNAGTGIETGGSTGTSVNIGIDNNIQPSVITVNSGSYKGVYKIDNPKNNKISFKSAINKKVTQVSIPKNISINGKKYVVTSIADNAFKNNTKLKTVTIGNNITSIGKNAFGGCKKLVNIKIKSTKLTKKTIAKNAFKGINKKVKIKVPKSKVSAYKKLFKSKGLPKAVKVTK